MKFLVFQQPSGVLAITSLAVPPTNFGSVGAEIVASGKFPVFCGAFSMGELPVPNIDVLRFSAGALVVKLSVASDRQWKILRREAQKKLDESNDEAMKALESGVPNAALLDYRNQLRAIIAAKPAELTAAVNLSSIETARPTVLDRPIPR